MNLQNKIFVTFFLLLSNICVAQPKIQFKSKLIDFGTLSYVSDGKGDTTLKAEFVFYNIGDKPLLIQTRCSFDWCYGPDYTRTAINPNDSGKIVLHCSKVSQIGKESFRSTCTVESNAVNSPDVIEIRGIILKND